MRASILLDNLLTRSGMYFLRCILISAGKFEGGFLERLALFFSNLRVVNWLIPKTLVNRFFDVKQVYQLDYRDKNAKQELIFSSVILGKILWNWCTAHVYVQMLMGLYQNFEHQPTQYVINFVKYLTSNNKFSIWKKILITYPIWVDTEQSTLSVCYE